MERSTKASPRSGRFIDLAVVATVVVVTVVFWLWRIPDAERAVVYSEDGAVFLFDWTRFDLLRGLLDPYAGYQHLIPRIVSGIIGATMPLELYGAAAQAASVLVLAAIAGSTVILARDVVASRVARLCIALVPVVLPLAGNEVLGNLSNLHTYCMWLAAWLLLWRPRSWTASGIGAVAMVLATMTEVQTLLLLPLALVRLWWMRDRMLPIVVAFGVGVAGQLVTWFVAPRGSDSGAEVHLGDVIVGWLIAAVRPIVMPSDGQALTLLRDLGPAPFLLILLPFALAVVIVLVLGDGRQRAASITGCLLSACMFGGSVVASPSTAFDWAGREGEEWDAVFMSVRYGVAAGMWIAMQVPLAIDVLVTRLGRAGSRHARLATVARGALLAIAVASIAAMAVVAPQSGSLREGGPDWSDDVAAAVELCQAGAETAPIGLVPIGRAVYLPCDVVLADAAGAEGS